MRVESVYDALLDKLIKYHATDCYILPKGNKYQILCRANQAMIHLANYSWQDGLQMIAYLKYQANMAVSEHRRPQSGALHLRERDMHINIRFSSVGDFRGAESLVIRLIYPLSSQEYRMLNFKQWDYLSQMTRGQGLILFAGPTGSGKTTTMYHLVKTTCRNQVVLSIEDPVEIQEEEFIQLQVNPTAKMSYQELLRLGLRHRPQVLIVGEIRDPTTAQTAIEAALSGHLVLATIHARSASGVIPRLTQLGIADYYLQQALLGACYQRMIPLKNSQAAVLFDLKDIQQLREENDNAVGKTWQEELRRAFQKNKIDQKVMEQFWQG